MIELLLICLIGFCVGMIGTIVAIAIIEEVRDWWRFR